MGACDWWLVETFKPSPVADRSATAVSRPVRTSAVLSEWRRQARDTTLQTRTIAGSDLLIPRESFPRLPAQERAVTRALAVPRPRLTSTIPLHSASIDWETSTSSTAPI